MSRKDKRMWSVTAQVEFEVEALDFAEASELTRTFVTTQMVGEESGLGVSFKSVEALQGRLL